MTNGSDGGLVYRMEKPELGEPPYPTLIMLHGRGSNELDLLSLGHELDPRLLVVSPRAPHILGPDSYHWYDLEAELARRPSPESLEASLDLVLRLLDEISKIMPVDRNRLVVGGFSMGGAMTAAMLLTHPDRLAGAMILSGYVPIHTELRWRLEAAANKPVFQAHGLYDDVLPLQFGRMSRDYLESAGVELTYREYPIAHQISPEEIADASAWLASVI